MQIQTTFHSNYFHTARTSLKIVKQFGILDGDLIGHGVYEKRSAVGISNEEKRFSMKGRFRLHIVSVERNGV